MGSFEAALEAIRARVDADIGPRDIEYVANLDHAALWLERIGRGWVITSGGPLGFAGGVTCQWIGKQLRGGELRNAALSGVFDRFTDATKYHAIDVRTSRPYLRELVWLPVLAGPMWWKAMLGNALSEILHEVFTAAIAHRETNVSVPKPLSILLGGADLAIERRLFPTLPPHRLREIAPEVRRACEEHGVAYPVDGLTQALGKVFDRVRHGVLARRRGIVRAA